MDPPYREVVFRVRVVRDVRAKLCASPPWFLASDPGPCPPLLSSPLLLLLAVAPPGSRLVSWLVSRCPGGCPGLAPSVSRLVSRCSGGCPGVASPVSRLVSRLVSRPPPPRHGPVVSRWCPGWCPGLLLAVASCCPDGVPWCPGVSRLVSRGVPGCPYESLMNPL